MYCKNCGHECLPEHNFCGKCGTPLSASASAKRIAGKAADKGSELFSEVSNSEIAQKVKERYKGDKKFRWAAQAAGVMLILGVGAMLIPDDSSSSSYSSSSSRTSTPSLNTMYEHLVPSTDEASLKRRVDESIKEYYKVKAQTAGQYDMASTSKRASKKQMVQANFQSLINATSDPVKNQQYRRMMMDFMNNE